MNKLIWLIILFGFLLRVLWLNQFPAGFTPDEASFGYDAYSLLKTGKDQWGRSFPLVLESFGDYKPPLYSYILIPFVGVFGLEKWVIRLPNALFGTASIYVTFLLVGQILKISRKNKKTITKIEKTLPFLSALILAISPWHIMLSRGAFEANLTTFFLPLGIYFFLKGQEFSFLNNKHLYSMFYFFGSAFVFGLNMFSYHSAKVITPLVVMALLFLREKRSLSLTGFFSIFNKNKIFISAFSIFVLITFYTFTQGAGARVNDINVFKGALEEASKDRSQAVLLGLSENISRIFYSKYQIGLERFIDRYVDYFSPQFFSTDGPAEATYGMIPGLGVLYVFEIIFLISFLVNLKKNLISKYIYLIIFWFLISPIPAALTSGPSYSANRAAIMMPSVQILIAMGILSLKAGYSKFKNYAVFGLYGFMFLSYLFNYIYIAPFKWGDKMLEGNLEMAEFVSKNSDLYSEIVIDRRLSEPHIFIAFVQKTDPNYYQKQTKNWNYKKQGLTWVDQMPSYNLGKYSFKNVHLNEYVENKSALLVGRPEFFSNTIEPLKVIKYPSGQDAIYIVDSKTINEN